MNFPGRDSTLHPTFSSFPDGRAGVGLILLRVAVGAELAWWSYSYLAPWQNVQLPVVLMAAAALVCTLALLLGYLTFFFALSSAFVSVGTLFGWPASANPDFNITKLDSLFTAIIGVALACLGPGAFSLDACRYGRREIIILKRGPGDSKN